MNSLALAFTNSFSKRIVTTNQILWFELRSLISYCFGVCSALISHYVMWNVRQHNTGINSHYLFCYHSAFIQNKIEFFGLLRNTEMITFVPEWFQIRKKSKITAKMALFASHSNRLGYLFRIFSSGRCQSYSYANKNHNVHKNTLMISISFCHA